MFIRKLKFPIRSKLAWLVSLAVILSVSIYGWYVVNHFIKDKIKYIYDTNLSYTNTVAKQVSVDLDNLDQQINFLKKSVQKEDFDQTTTELIHALLENNKNIINFSLYKYSKNLVDTEGKKNIVNSVEDFTVFYSISNKRFFKMNQVSMEEVQDLGEQLVRKGVQHREIASGVQFTFEPNPEKAFFSYVVPVTHELYNKMVLHINKEFLSRSFDLSKIHSLFLMFGDEILAKRVVSGDEDIVENSHPAFNYGKKTNVQQASFEYSVPKITGEQSYVGSFFRLMTPLTLYTQVNTKYAYSNLRQIIYNTVLFALILLILFVMASILTSTNLTRPLESLTKAADDLAAGNYEINPKIHSHDEIGVLSDHLINLGSRLSQREQSLEKMTDLANYDGLTKVFNNRHFKELFKREMYSSDRYNHSVGFLIMDIDHFKKFNDTYGHQQGDQVLREFAQILQNTSRETDIVARYGGEEFVVILPQTGIDGVKIIADRIRKAYEDHDIINLADGSIIKSTVSVGCAVYKHKNYGSMQEVIEHADKKLYEAKRAGRNQIAA